MSLDVAVLGVAEAMELESTNHSSQSPTSFILLSFARELRTAVKAAEGVANQQTASPYFTAEDQHRTMIDQARAELRRAKLQSDAEEKLSPRLCQIADGPWEGTTVPVAPNAGNGFVASFDENKYQLRADGKLYLVGESGLDIKS